MLHPSRFDGRSQVVRRNLLYRLDEQAHGLAGHHADTRPRYFVLAHRFLLSLNRFPTGSVDRASDKRHEAVGRRGILGRRLGRPEHARAAQFVFRHRIHHLTAEREQVRGQFDRPRLRSVHIPGVIEKPKMGNLSACCSGTSPCGEGRVASRSASARASCNSVGQLAKAGSPVLVSPGVRLRGLLPDLTPSTSETIFAALPVTCATRSGIPQPSRFDGRYQFSGAICSTASTRKPIASVAIGPMSLTPGLAACRRPGRCPCCRRPRRGVRGRRRTGLSRCRRRWPRWSWPRRRRQRS